MPQELENVIVERISLVTDEATPAVPKAETRFALFKAFPKRLIKLQSFLGKETTPSVEQLLKVLENNQTSLKS